MYNDNCSNTENCTLLQKFFCVAQWRYILFLTNLLYGNILIKNKIKKVETAVWKKQNGIWLHCTEEQNVNGLKKYYFYVHCTGPQHTFTESYLKDFSSGHGWCC